MTEVLIPYYNIPGQLAIVKDVFECYYGTKCGSVTFNRMKYLTIVTSSSLGKQPVFLFLKRLGVEYGYFVKETVLYKKYCDTGIVEKLGTVELKDQTYEITGV